MLEIILKEIIAGTRATPHNLTNGARLVWNAGAQQLIITRNNKAPDEAEMKIFAAYIKRVGYRISTREMFETDAQAINSQVGYVLQLVKLEPETPAAVQGSLF